MKNIVRIAAFCLLGYLLYGCSKQDTQFESYLNGHEVKYPGTVANAHSRPGNLRAAITWNPSTDPSITRYVIYWNNKADSIIFNSTNHNPSDSLTVVVPNLNEYIYSFTVFSYDAKGNRSIPLDINNVRVYGPIYQSGLVNRAYNVADPYDVSIDGKIRLNFLKTDTSVINVGTTIKYTNRAGSVKEKVLTRDSLSLTIPDFKSGTTIQFRSSYIPKQNAVDTFSVVNYEDFPKVFGYFPCDKSLFKEVHLPGDAGTYESGTSISKLWDGSVGPQGYPNIFHSDGDHPLPHTISFDMGKLYKLTQIEETGRNCCNNPDDFEIWGIADITNATTTLSPNNSGWPAEAASKGWTLLGEVKRNDDGMAAFKYNFDSNIPSVRYIRVRVKHVTNGDNNYSNMSELTFLYDVLN